ncbi:MAG: VCBS repeat-containing protein [Planctomycetes bacterium]|nr:VCBS repeat-containing protein [Planctomycetota bacterium]
MTAKATFAILVSLAAAACRSDAGPDLYGMRTRACLHAQRDTDDGYTTAIALLTQVVRQPQATFEDWLNLARAQVLHRGASAEAWQSVAKARAIGSDPRGLAALDYVEGLLLVAKLDDTAAHRKFEQVLAALHDHPEALYQSGYAAERAGLLDVARQRYRRLIEIDRLVRPAAYRLARTETLRKDDAAAQKALALFQKRDANEKPETTKCDLTDLGLVRYDRRAVEGAVQTISWRVRPLAVPEPVQLALPCPGSTAGSVDLVLVGRSAVWSAPRGTAPLTRTDLPVHGTARAVLADLDNRPGAELVLADQQGVRAAARATDGTWRATTIRFPALPGGTPPAALAAFDADHDGDLDLLVLTGAAPHRLVVLRNDGAGAFTLWQPCDVTTDCAAVRIDAHDLDQANDLDLVCPGSIALNLRGDRYRRIDMPDLAARSVLVVEDLDNDGAPDLFAAGGNPGWVLRRNADPRGRPYQVAFGPAEVAPSNAPTVRDAVAGDVDNDGDLDLLLATAQGVVVLRNHARTFALVPPVALPGGAVHVEVADFGADGGLDVVAVDARGGVHVLAPERVPPGVALEVVPEGRKDNRSAVGAVVEAFAGRQFQSRMVKGPAGVRLALGQPDLRLLDGLRLRWPQGIVQAVPRSKLGTLQRRIALQQIEGLVASCPFLYACEPSGYRFVTDVVGIAPLAEWLPPGAKPALDPEEWVRIDGTRLALRDGSVELAITEELKETTYLDRVELWFVDHDPKVELRIDENVLQGAYEPLRIHGFAARDFTPVSATLQSGRDATQLVAARDRRYAHPYPQAPSQWGGWTEPYSMELQTRAPAQLLLLEGRLAWYDSTVSYALAQNGRGWTPLRIERLRPGKPAEVLVADAGLPTGMDRTMIVSLGDAPLPAGTRLRLCGQHRFLWDRIRTARRPTRTVPEPARAKLVTASTFAHGYARYLGKPGSHELSYAFADAAPDDRYPRARGFANEYGDVAALLAEHDDRLVVLVAGDGVRMRFAAPPVAPKKSRTYFMKISGWAKEGSFHNATGQSILPLPFRAMTAYPPPPGERTPWFDADRVLTRRVR